MPESETSNRLAELEAKIDKAIEEFKTLHQANEERDQLVLNHVSGIHETIAKMIEDSKAAGAKRNEAIVKSTQRVNRWTIQSAKFVVGSILLFMLTLIVMGTIAYVSPQDLFDQFRRWIPLLGAAVLAYTGYLIYGIRPSAEGEKQTRDEQIATGTNSESARDPENSP